MRGRHCCLGFAASAQLPVTLSPASLQARSKRRADYSPERLGHVPPIDFCNCMNSQARPRSAKTPPLEPDGKPPDGRWCRSCETSPAELLQPRVRAPQRGGLRRPLRRPSRHIGLSPTCRTSDIPCRSPAPAADRNRRRQAARRMLAARRRRAWPLPAPRCRHPNAVTGELARRARNAEASRALKGRRPSPLAKALTVNRTRDAFHPRDQRLLSGDASKAASQPWFPTAVATTSTPLLPPKTTTLTGLPRRWLSHPAVRPSR
jgi:hypothetical protein